MVTRNPLNIGAATVGHPTPAPGAGVDPVIMTGPNALLYLDAGGSVRGGGLAGMDYVDEAVAGASGKWVGEWNAATNSPALTAGVGEGGESYTVSVAGTQSITGSAVTFAVGDEVRFSEVTNSWRRIPNFQAVTSVNGLVGGVILGFATRAELVSMKDAFANNVVVNVGRFAFVKDGGVEIDDMLGWSPYRTASPEHWNAGGAGLSDDSIACQKCAAYGGCQEWFGDYRTSLPCRPKTGSFIDGGMSGQVKAVDGSPAFHAFDIRGANGQSKITIVRLTIDGNRAARPGVTAGNGVMCLAEKVIIEDCDLPGWPRSSVFLDGNTTPCRNVHLRRLTVRGCGQVGVSMSKVERSSLTFSVLEENGLENLTLDGESLDVKVTANDFGVHYGGAGSIGWDGGDSCIFAMNVVDNKNDTTAGPGNRNCICINSNTHLTEEAIIAVNVLRNAADHAVKFRDRTSTGGVKAGRALLAINAFKGNATDILVEDTDQQIMLRGNLTETAISNVETSPDNLSLDAGSVIWAAGLSANKAMTVSTSYQPILFDAAAYSKNCTLAGATGKISVIAGGDYALTFKVRLTGLTATASTEMAIRLQQPGSPDEVLNFRVGGNIEERQITVIKKLAKGDIWCEIRSIDGSGGYTIVSGAETFFQGVLIA